MTVQESELRALVESLDSHPTPLPYGTIEAFAEQFLSALERGSIRAASPEDGHWVVHGWVKRGILLLFRHGVLSPIAHSGETFFDKHTLPPRRLSLDDRVRLVPGGSAIRRGAYVAPGVICMPPMYINVGAYVGEGTMVDSHALIGTCAQIGARVHISAAAQIGGVLEPAQAQPVIIEDDAFIGGNVGIYEGVLVRRRAVIAAGVMLTASVPVYDAVHERILRASDSQPLEIPEGAVVVPGTRRLSNSSFSIEHGLQASCALIVKYRDERTDAKTALEATLRL
ncbi:2,3,4,5-tetrahydropyridine-2,6-dicarboxylate N-succinyltransferase [bacterium HR20]|jgi:2,3,4,5-tetrahydropyridine-2-carboxylate N-succinyltransferase|nr:2,3,4,5-tetrahydropyridine-2,6-dicarboxylate N-succinyltransferase [bacterium HR20]